MKNDIYSVLVVVCRFSTYYVYSYVQVGIISYGKVLLQIVRYSSGGQLHVLNLVSTGTGNLPTGLQEIIVFLKITVDLNHNTRYSPG